MSKPKSKPTAKSTAKSKAKTKAKTKAKAKTPRTPQPEPGSKSKRAARPVGSRRTGQAARSTGRRARTVPPKKKKSELAAVASAPPSPTRPGPITRRRAQLLLGLEETLSRRIVGKGDAVARIARSVRVRKAQLDFRPDRPDGSFLLVGPTGVGKNEIAYAVAEALLGSEERVVSIDLGELSEEADIPKLGVTPVPGTEGQAMEGLLTSPIRRDPEAVILLRGLERAHPSFQPLLQQMLERGRLEDMLGPVSFSRTIVFVTTRPRRDETALEIGFSRQTFAPGEALRKRLERSFIPDLLDAFNEVIELPPLSPDDVRRIARYKVGEVLRRLHRRRTRVSIAERVFEAVIPEADARRDGAATLNRTLEVELFHPLAHYLLSHRGSRTIRVDMVDGRLEIGE